MFDGRVHGDLINDQNVRANSAEGVSKRKFACSTRFATLHLICLSRCSPSVVEENTFELLDLARLVAPM